ncbi:MAG: STAS domain-containing protein [Planctomycetota bacterium]
MLAIATGCELDVERGPDWLFVRVRSFKRDTLNSWHLADELWSLLERHSTHRLVLELDRVPTLNEHLVDQLSDLYARVHEHGGVLRICGLSEAGCRVLSACELVEHCHPYSCREEAVLGHPLVRRPR